MNCLCGKTPNQQMLCQDCDDQPIPAPLWEQATSAATMTDLLITVARLDARVTLLEQELADRTADS